MSYQLSEAATAAWDEIAARLAALKAPIDAEIRAYPLPIPGCDAQYNHLLERRGEIAREIVRLGRARAASPAGRAGLREIEAFLDACALIDDNEKASIRQSMHGPVRRAG